jgi:hypothetical protein
MEDTSAAAAAVVRCPKQAWFVATKGRSAGYFRRHHASQADIPHVAVDNNLALNVRTQFFSIKHLHYSNLSWRKGNIHFSAYYITEGLCVRPTGSRKVSMYELTLCSANRIKKSLNVRTKCGRPTGSRKVSTYELNVAVPQDQESFYV